MATNASVPAGSYSLELHVGETRLGEPVDVLLLRRKEHPYIGEKPGEPKCGMHGTDEASLPSLLQHSVRFCNAALRIGPVLNAAGNKNSQLPKNEQKEKGPDRIEIPSLNVSVRKLFRKTDERR